MSARFSQQSFEDLHFTDAHRLFVQAMMYNKIYESSEIIQVFKQCLELSNAPVPEPDQISEAFHDFMSTCNRGLKKITLCVVPCIDEGSGKSYYALICTTNRNMSGMFTVYSKQELEFMRRMVESIIHSCEGCISSEEALNMTKEIGCFQKAVAQTMIEKFVDDKWLFQGEGILRLSPRCIAELDNFLRSNYPDVIGQCNLCANIVIQAVKCTECGVKLHRHCINEHLTSQTSCPNCDKKWKEPGSSGEIEEVKEEKEEEEMAACSSKGTERPHE